MATQIDLGAVVPIGKGDWNIGTTYERANIVRHNSAAWVCKVESSTGVEPIEDSSDWYLLTKDISSVTSVNGQKGDVILDIISSSQVDEKITEIKNEIESSIPSIMIGASDEISGKSGLVPAPSAGDQDKFLKGDGTWAYLSGMPIGTIFWSASATPVDGALLCNGTTPLIATYPDLYAVIGTTYGGDGVTTFGLPNLIDRVAWGATTPGTYLEAGLPNISGTLGGYVTSALGKTPTGAFKNSDEPFGNGNPGVGSASRNVYMDASAQNSIYGNSNTVQPPALTLVPYIKAYDTVQNTGSMDAAELASEINRLDGKFGDYLSTSGGTMTGTYPTIKKDDTKSGIIINGGKNLDTGASLYLYGKDRDGGGWCQIITRDANGAGNSLVIRPGGTLTWAGKNVVRSVNGTAADAEGNVSISNTSTLTKAATKFRLDYTTGGGSGYLPRVISPNYGTKWLIAEGTLSGYKTGENPTYFKVSVTLSAPRIVGPNSVIVTGSKTTYSSVTVSSNTIYAYRIE